MAKATSSHDDDEGGGPAGAKTRPQLSKTAELDKPLHTLGFEMGVLSADLVSGRLMVTETCCQPFKKLHGGVSALMAEALASMGAQVASGFRRVAGIQLSINHLKSAQVGDEIVAEATPVNIGRTIQVWEVRLWKVDPSASEKGDMVASSRVTLVTNMPVPENARDAAPTFRKYANSKL